MPFFIVLLSLRLANNLTKLNCFGQVYELPKAYFAKITSVFFIVILVYRKI